MQQRKRLLRMNRKPLDSFDQASPIQSRPSNVLDTIHNQSLYLKLVGIALEMSREAGVSQNTLQEVQQKLLRVKGFQEYSMLDQNKKKQIISHKAQNKNSSYNISKKYFSTEEQSCFLKRLQKQTIELQTKQHLIYALKSFIQQKKKTFQDTTPKQQVLTRGKFFLQKLKSKTNRKKLQRSTFYGQTIKDIVSRIAPSKSCAYDTIRKMTHLKTLWGHTFFTESQQQYCPVYNVIFDNTQKLILTGGEDGKIKVWSRYTGALIKTLQGHKDFINKISITKDNKMVLSAGRDGVRFFDLDNMNSLGGFQTQSIMDIGEILNRQSDSSQIIFANGKKLYVISSKQIRSLKNRRLECHHFKVYNFGSQVRQDINTNTMTITQQGIVFLGFIEGQILIFDFNKLHQAEIDPDNYGIAQGIPKVPQFILPITCVLNAHEGDIIQITWNPNLSYFTTGAKKDGVCKIWQFRHNQESNRPVVIKELKIPKYKMKRKKKIYNCNFCCWNSTFTHVTCSYQEQQQQEETDNRGDGQVIVYNAKRGQVTWQMSKTIQLSSIRALDCHPFYPNIMLICDSYGKIILADIFENYIVNLFEERAFHLNHPSFCLVPSQCRFSQDGMNFLVASQYGNFSIYGYDIKEFYHLYPTQQLFTNDYYDFQIDPGTLRPVLSIGSTQDINQFKNGELQNMRHLPYTDYQKIDPISFRFQCEHPQRKIQHRNHSELCLKQVQRLSQLYLERDRQLEMIKKNLEQIENKRMTILFYQKETLQQKLRQVIQQKSQKIRQIDQGVTSGLFSNSNSQNNSSIMNAFSNQAHENNENREQNANPRRRGRRSTRNVQNNQNLYHRINRYNPLQSDSNNEEIVSPRNRQDEQQYIVDNLSQGQFIQSGEEELEQDQEFNQDNQSDLQYILRRTRRQRNTRRSRPNYNSNNSYSRMNRLRRNIRRRPPQEQIQQLQNAYQQQLSRPRKRNQQGIEQAQVGQQALNQDQQQSRKQMRRIASRAATQMRHNTIREGSQKKQCDLCLFKQAAVQCYQCRSKKYCEGCQVYRGKKISEYSKYICFQCYYVKNVAPQAHKNISHQKYIMSQRSDLFVPQIGDQVAYFFQGYQEFLSDKIQILNNKFLELGVVFDIVPHEAYPQLINIQKCTVVDSSYAFPLQQQTNLQLNYKYKSNTNRNRGRTTKSNLNLNMNLNLNIQDILTLITLRTASGLEFKIFHFPGYQYLLKWEIYDDIMMNDRYGKFKMFDIVRIKDEQIQIMEIRPLNPTYNNSIWKNIIVLKAQTKNLRRNRDKNDDIAINIWNIDGFIDPKAFQYHHPASDFKQMSPQTRQMFKQKILSLEQNQPRMWEVFLQFVDTDIYPYYTQYVQVGICLRLIVDRLQNNYYACYESFMKDLNMLVENSISFNGKQSQITELAERLVKIIQQTQNCNDGNSGYKNISNEVDQSIQVNNSTQKKTKTKKRNINSGSSARQPEQQPQQRITRKRQIKVSKFQDQIIDIENKHLPVNTREKQKLRQKQKQKQKQRQKERERQKQKEKQRLRGGKRRKRDSQSQQYFKVENDSKQESSESNQSQSVKPVTRSQRRFQNQKNIHQHKKQKENDRQKQKNQNCRVTRSRTKN